MKRKTPRVRTVDEQPLARRDEKSERAESAPVEYDFHAKRTWAWRKVEKLATSARKEETRLAALREFLKRTDPEPKGVDELERLRTELDAVSRRGFTLNVAIITGRDGPPPSTNGYNAPSQSDPDGGEIRIISGPG